MIFKNKNFNKRDYEATNVVACEAEVAPDENWIPAPSGFLGTLLSKGAQQLWIQGGVKYFGWL
jgi:hypothetical protein